MNGVETCPTHLRSSSSKIRGCYTLLRCQSQPGTLPLFCRGMQTWWRRATNRLQTSEVKWRLAAPLLLVVASWQQGHSADAAAVRDAGGGGLATGFAAAAGGGIAGSFGVEELDDTPLLSIGILL